MSEADSAGAGETVYNVIVGVIRAASNILAMPVWAAILWSLGGLIGVIDGADNVFEAFAIGFRTGWEWTFGTLEGVIVGLVFVAFGVVHAIRIGIGRSYASVLGFFAFLFDHTWSFPNTVVGSIFATITLYRDVNKTKSNGAGVLYLDKGLAADYDTTIGNVIAGNIVPKHEYVHVVQAWICGPFFFPIYILNYVVNTVAPLWLIPFALGWPYGGEAIKGFGDYFMKGVYPYTLFEMVAYAIEGHPPAYSSSSSS